MVDKVHKLPTGKCFVLIKPQSAFTEEMHRTHRLHAENCFKTTFYRGSWIIKGRIRMELIVDKSVDKTRHVNTAYLKVKQLFGHKPVQLTAADKRTAYTYGDLVAVQVRKQFTPLMINMFIIDLIHRRKPADIAQFLAHGDEGMPIIE